MSKAVYAGSDDYIVSRELSEIVNVAIALERPLLIKGEPGTGKTLLAYSIAKSLGKDLLRWNVKSTTKAQEGLYVYDTVQRLNDSRFGGGDVADVRRYIKYGPLGRAFLSDAQVVLLIDEIDKADIEFPNDLLAELDEMRFFVNETQETVSTRHRPIVIITSNSEKELPDAFLRRCVFHFIDFPDAALMRDIVNVHFEKLDQELLRQCLAKFYRVRELRGLRKKPATSELIDWIRALIAGGLDPAALDEGLPYAGALLKKEQDLQALGLKG